MLVLLPRQEDFTDLAHQGVAMLLAASLAAMLSGCVSFDAADARRAQTESYANSLSQLEATLLSHPLTLDDCLEIAMTNNYAARRAYEVAAAKAEDLMARSKEGLESVSDVLDAEAAREIAEAEFLRAAFTERVARANLDFAVWGMEKSAP